MEKPKAFTDEYFDLKYQLGNEYLRNGGTQKLTNVDLINDLMNFNYHNPATHTSRIKAFLNTIFFKNQKPPIVKDNEMAEYISFLQKSIFFDQVKIDTEKQIDELFEKYKDTSDYIFRGQREASWRLYNTIQRSWICENYNNEFNFSSVLKNMVDDGKIQYAEQIKALLEKDHIDTVNDLAILGFLQHHCCATPLLDWTSSFENAMFFAIDGVVDNIFVKEIGDYISVYYLHNDNIEPAGAGNIIDNALKEEGDAIKSYLIKMIAKTEEEKNEMEEHFKNKDFFDRSKIEGAGLISHMCEIDNMLGIPTGINYYREKYEDEGIVFSLMNSENIKIQKGAFIWNSDPIKPLEVMAIEAYDNEDHSYRFCDCYNINKKLIPYIKVKLNELGVTNELIYPDQDINTKHVFPNSIEKMKQNKK